MLPACLQVLAPEGGSANSTIEGMYDSMKYEPNWGYCRLDGEERAKMIETMIGNSEAMATLAETAEVEAENVQSDLWRFGDAAGEVFWGPPNEFEERILRGTWVVTPILVAFSIEIALKAVIAQEATNPWLKTHDLELLYHQLTEEQHRQIDGVETRPTHSTLTREPVPVRTALEVWKLL